MKYFSITELTRSTTAQKHGIANTPNPAETLNLERLVNNLLDPIREEWKGPINVNSGFRNEQVNKLVGGSSTSQHRYGEAADITVGSPAQNKKLFDMIRGMADEGRIEFDQLIDEQKYSWLHISFRCGRNRGQVLHL